MEHVHSIIIIKKGDKFLNYYDKRWQMYLFPNIKGNNIEEIKSLYNTNNVKLLFDKIHDKYSVPNKKVKTYHHYFYEVNENIDGEYFTLEELLKDDKIKENNEDIINFIKEYYKRDKISIIVCSKNKAKNNAVNNVVKDFFDKYEIKSLETNSGVSETPMSNDEGIKGCINRIKDALKQDNNADLYIAMEGILNTNKFGTFLCGWTVIYDKKSNEYSYGCSAQIKVPDKIINNLDKNTRLSKKVADYTNSTDEIVSEIGTNGMLTNGCYTRTDEFTDSILCAISSKYKKLIKTR